MSLAPVFPLLSAAAPVTAIVGTNPVRIYPGGIIPEGIPMPAISWLTVAGMPMNLLADRANTDNQRVQIDCWALTFAEVRTLSEAVRDALEDHAYCVAFNDPEGASTNTGFDPATKRFRISCDWSFWIAR